MNERKIRILIVLRHPVGGIRTFLKYTYNCFDKTKYHLTILTIEHPEIKILKEDLRDFNLECIVASRKRPLFSFGYKILAALLKEKFDLIHSHGFTAGIFTAIPARLSRTKHIMTSHDVLLPKQFKGVKGFFRKHALSFLLPLINVIHSVSNDAQKNLLEFFPNLKKYPNKCITILNGIDTEQFRTTDRRDFRKEINLSEDTFLIGFLGRFMSQKGFLYLVQAMEQLIKAKQLPKTPHVLTFNEGGFVREEMAAVRKKGLEKYFHFLPFVPNIASTLRGLDVLVIPSLWEACPLLPMEAMVAGVPVIGTDCIGLREVLKDTPSVMVPAANSAALADSIEKEMRSPSKEKVKLFVEKAIKKFNVRTQALAIENIFINLMKS